MSFILREIAESIHEWASERAEYALRIKSAVDHGDIPPDIAVLLLADSIVLDKVTISESNFNLRDDLIFGVNELIGSINSIE